MANFSDIRRKAWYFLSSPINLGAIHIHKEGEEQTISYVIGKFGKDFFEIEKSGTGLDALHKTLSNYYHVVPFVVAITGKEILIKMHEKGISPGIIPGKGDARFVIEEKTFHQLKYYGIARKEVIQEVITPILDKDIFVKGINIGFSSVLNDLFEKEIKTEINIYPYRLNFKAMTISPIKTGEDNSDYLLGEMVNGKEKLARTALLSAASGDTGITIDDVNTLEIDYAVAFKKMLLYATIIIFSLTLLGYSSFDYLLSETRKKETILEELRIQHKKALEQAEIAQKTKKLLGSLGRPIRYSEFVDEFAMTVPNEIVLSSLSINPNEKEEVKPGKPYKFQDNLWEIEGASKNAAFLNFWLEEVKELDWIEKTSIITFQESRDTEDYYFKLEIRTNF